MMSSRILRSQPPSRCWARWMRREQPQSRGLRSIQDSPSTAFVMPPMHGSTIRPTLPRAIEGMRLAGVPEGVMSAIGHSRHFLIRTSDVCLSPDSGGIRGVCQRLLRAKAQPLQPAAREQEPRGRQSVEKTATAGWQVNTINKRTVGVQHMIKRGPAP